MDKTLCSSKNTDWETPENIFNPLNEYYGFTLDVCANDANKKCSVYFTVDDDGLNKDWSNDICWMNPPYGKDIYSWIAKAYSTFLQNGTVVALLPARTDTKWFHDFILNKANVYFLKGRIKFVGAESSAPFPSMVVVWNDKPKSYNNPIWKELIKNVKSFAFFMNKK